MKKRTGIYLSAPVVLKNPEYVRVLSAEIGLNLVVLSYTGEPSHQTLACSPFDEVPLSDSCLHALLSRHLDGGVLDPEEFDLARKSVGPAVGASGNDRDLHQALEILRQAGMEIWLCMGSWTGSSLMYCPSKAAVNDWFEALYVECATRYDVDGLDLTHARFPKCSVPRGLFACSCDDCAREASALGYDMEAMKAALRSALERLHSVDAQLLAQLSRTGAGPFDYLQLLGLQTGVVDWFRFRADLLSAKLGRFHSAVHAAAAPEFIFGSDTYPASLSMFVGHNHAAWADFSDFASPLVSHISSFTGHAFVAWAEELQKVNPGLNEADALQVVYRVAGYDGMGLPETIAAYELEHPQRLAHVLPLEELILRDLRKTRLLLPPQMPSYPIIHGEGWPRAAIDAILRGAEASGHDGIVWQGTSELVNFPLK